MQSTSTKKSEQAAICELRFQPVPKQEELQGVTQRITGCPPQGGPAPPLEVILRNHSPYHHQHHNVWRSNLLSRNLLGNGIDMSIPPRDYC